MELVLKFAENNERVRERVVTIGVDVEALRWAELAAAAFRCAMVVPLMTGIEALTEGLAPATALELKPLFVVVVWAVSS